MPAAEDDLEVREYVAVIWEYRRIVLAITVATVAGVLAWSVSRPPLYESSVTLMVSQSKIGDQPAAAGGMPGFRALLQNRALATKVIHDFGLDETPHRLTPSAFVTSVVRVDEVPGTNLLQAKVRLGQSDLAARVANRLAEQAVELNRAMNQEETRSARDFIKQQLDQARTNLDQLEQALLAQKRQSQLALVRVDANALLAQRAQLLTLGVEIASERARVEKAQDELARHERVLPIGRLSDTSAALLEAARRIDAERETALAAALRRDALSVERQDAAPSMPAENAPERRERVNHAAPPIALPLDPALGGLDLRSAVINPVYEVLEYQVAIGRTRLAALERRRDELLGAHKLGAGQLGKLGQLYTREVEVARLETEYSLAKAAYVELATQHEQARLQVASRTAQLQVVDPAIPAEGPIAPRPTRNALLAFAVALVGSIALVLLIDYLRPIPALARRPRA